MKDPLDQLVEISRFYGSDKEFVLAGGGNTSFKVHEKIWVKASGIPLGTIHREGFVVLSREKLDQISSKTYSNDPDERERQVKEDLDKSKVNPGDHLRPSVETSFHNLVGYAFVIHLHPALVNGLMCAKDSARITKELFRKDALYVPYTDPGHTLFKKIENELNKYRSEHTSDPKLIFLENHGVIVSADNPDEIRSLYSHIIKTISGRLKEKLVITQLPDHPDIKKVLPALRMSLSDNQGKILKYRHNSLTRYFYDSASTFKNISLPFSPDNIVYCKSRYLYSESNGKDEELIESVKKELKIFRKKYNYDPKIILVKDFGLIAADENAGSAETALDVYEDVLKISFYTESFGGPRFMNDEQITFIDNWEVEHYRRKVAKGSVTAGKVENKIAIVTGSAQGFGAGIAEDLFREGANVVIADMNEQKGRELANKIRKQDSKNQCIFIPVDVSEPASVESLILNTVKYFGGLDLLVSNAGILHAGSLEEMEPGIFNKMTSVNYTGYYLCTKFSSEIFRIQHKYQPGYYTDIIQINSKSGLKGSKKNFAYAGAKFGGIGLTQSFALELVQYNVKVNSICPGNYFDGPLWSDPETGLFRQYLEAGKVPGAKTIEDIRRYYEEQVPMRRGCTVKDVMKAIYYVIDQKYETGQAIPVTGGQVMTS